MFEFLKKMSAKKKAPHSASDASNRLARSLSAMKREMIRLALKDTIKVFGIPPDWIQCYVVEGSEKADGKNTYIILEMQCWNENLLRYSHLIAENFLKRIGFYMADVDISNFHASWGYSTKCQSPYSVMPEMDLWAPLDNNSAQAPTSDYFDRRKNKREVTSSVFIHDDGLPKPDDAHYAPTSHSALE